MIDWLLIWSPLLEFTRVDLILEFCGQMVTSDRARNAALFYNWLAHQNIKYVSFCTTDSATQSKIQVGIRNRLPRNSSGSMGREISQDFHEYFRPDLMCSIWCKSENLDLLQNIRILSALILLVFYKKKYKKNRSENSNLFWTVQAHFSH